MAPNEEEVISKVAVPIAIRLVGWLMGLLASFLTGLGLWSSGFTQEQLATTATVIGTTVGLLASAGVCWLWRKLKGRTS